MVEYWKRLIKLTLCELIEILLKNGFLKKYLHSYKPNNYFFGFHKASKPENFIEPRMLFKSLPSKLILFFIKATNHKIRSQNCLE